MSNYHRTIRERPLVGDNYHGIIIIIKGLQYILCFCFVSVNIDTLDIYPLLYRIIYGSMTVIFATLAIQSIGTMIITIITVTTPRYNNYILICGISLIVR